MARPGRFDIFCNDAEMTFSCGIGSVIEIARADYGFNMDILGKCSKAEDLKNLDPCESDAGPELSAICNGKRTCRIYGTEFPKMFSKSKLLQPSDNCKLYQRHLKAKYICRQLTTIKGLCKLKNYRLNHGILLSSEQFRSNKMGPKCRLALKVEEGRRIRMELIDSTKRGSSRLNPRNNCGLYEGSYEALKVEQKDLRSKMICGGQDEVQTFETDSSMAEISVMKKILTNSSLNFLLNISGKHIT